MCRSSNQIEPFRLNAIFTVTKKVKKSIIKSATVEQGMPMLKCTILQRNNADYFDAVSWKQTSLKCASVDLLAAFLGKKSKRTKVWPQKVHLGSKYMKREKSWLLQQGLRENIFAQITLKKCCCFSIQVRWPATPTLSKEVSLLKSAEHKDRQISNNSNFQQDLRSLNFSLEYQSP